MTLSFVATFPKGVATHQVRLSLSLNTVVKLVPKVVSLMSFARWRPISLMNGLYKIFPKGTANRLQKVLSYVAHPM